MIRFLLCAAATLILVTGCSSSSGGGGGSATAPPGVASVTITASSGHLVGPDGRTLYTNSADSATHLVCTGRCLSIWPPVFGSPVAGSGVSARQLSTITRGSHTQVTFAGHPLYEFSSDMKAGDEKGNGLTDQGGTWTPAGAAASPREPAPSHGGGGYGYP
jgi:predicted lipoprotein with Yx(FWY)xxD motif